MPVSPISSPTGSAGDSGATTRSDPSIMGKDDFLQLLIGEMQNQDPTAPTDPTEQMDQMTQFSILEQITNLTQSQQAASENEYDQQAVGLLGRTVTYVRADGTNATGVVQGVTFTSNGPSLSIDNGESINPVVVTGVR